MDLDPPTSAWITSSCGDEVRSSRRLTSGAGSVIDLVALASGRRVVLRRVPPNFDVPGHDPSAEIRVEATALALLEGVPWAPSLVASDPDGVCCGVAASIQTVVPGRVEVHGGSRWIAAMAAATRAVARLTVGSDALPPFDPWVDRARLPPAWAANSSRWRRALELIDGWRPTGSHLVHRDLHPGNVLVEHGTFSGVVDWVHARRGPIEADVSRCRVEVAILADDEAADDLLRRCADLVPDYDHRWDLLVAAELAPWSHTLMGFNAHGARLELAAIHRRLERVVQSALAAIDGAR